MRLLYLLALLVALAGACSVDDDSVLEGKTCNILQGDTECIKPYKCICSGCPKGTTCCCSKNTPSSLAPGTFSIVEPGDPLSRPADEASLRLLRRQGVLPARGR